MHHAHCLAYLPNAPYMPNAPNEHFPCEQAEFSLCHLEPNDDSASSAPKKPLQPA